MGSVMKGFLIVLGLVIFFSNLDALAKRKMYPTFSVAWSTIAIVLVALGAVLRLDRLGDYMSWRAVALIMMGSAFVLGSVYISSVQISGLMSRNQELTMQVALLNEEMSRLRGKEDECEDA